MSRKSKRWLFSIIGVFVLGNIIAGGIVLFFIFNKFYSDTLSKELTMELKEKTEEFITNEYSLEKNEYVIADITQSRGFLDFSTSAWRYFVKVELKDARIDDFNITFDGYKEVTDSNYMLSMIYSYVDDYIRTLQPMEDYLTSLGFYPEKVLSRGTDDFIRINLEQDALWDELAHKIKLKEVVLFEEMLAAHPKNANIYIRLFVKKEVPLSAEEIEVKLKENFKLIDQNYQITITEVRLDEDRSIIRDGAGTRHEFGLH